MHESLLQMPLGIVETAIFAAVAVLLTYGLVCSYGWRHMTSERYRSMVFRSRWVIAALLVLDLFFMVLRLTGTI